VASEDEEFGTDTKVLLQRIARELTSLRRLVTEGLAALREAESEVPEKYRRFVNAFHDIHHVKWVYEEAGIDVPPHILRELERLDDRYRQIIAEYNVAGGAFDKVRREMASDPMNRWDHTRQLAAPTHKVRGEN